MKKLLSALIILSVLFSSYVFADDISVYLDNEPVTFDQPPIIKEDRTLVPVRAIFEALGADVEWVEAQKKIIAKRGYHTIVMKIDSRVMTVNNVMHVLDVAPVIVSDRTLVPVRAISEAFGIKTDWNEAQRTVILWTRDTGYTIDNLSKTVIPTE